MEPSTQDLPFVLVYGPWIWKLALVAIVGVAFALAALLRRVMARREQRAKLEGFDHGGDRDGVIRGVLGGRGDGPLAACVTVTSMYLDPQAAHWRADELWVETAEGRVELAGALHVELGTGGRARRHRLPEVPAGMQAAASELAMVKDKVVGVARLATLHAGDEVVVRGRLERAPGTEDTGFREASVAWKLLPETEELPLRIAARKPRGVLPRMSVVMMLAVGGISAFVGYKVMSAVGDDWREGCWNRDRYAHVEGFVELDGSDSCIRAAAMPRHQDRVYDALYNALKDHPYRDERSFRRVLALAEQSAGCEGVLGYLEEYGRFEDLAVHARRCGDAPRERNALVALGRYEEAARLKVDKPDINLLIATRQWGDAAALAEERANEYATHDQDTDGSYAAAALYFRCVAELFRHHAGDPAAATRLAKLEASERGQVCLPALVEAVPDAERRPLIERYDEQRGRSYDTERRLEMQSFLEGTWSPYEIEGAERVLAKLDDPLGRGTVRLAYLAKLAKPPTQKSPAHRTAARRWLAVAQVLDGDLDAALGTANESVAQVRQLRSEADPIDLYPLMDTALLPGLTALYGGTVVDVDIDTAGLEHRDPESARISRESRYFRFGRLSLRAGRSIASMYFGPAEQYVEALRAAQQGDGRPLAAYIGKGRYWTDGDVVAVLPLVKRNREWLIGQLPWASSYPSWRYAMRTPFDVAAAAAVRRQLFAVAGDAKRAAAWDQTYRRITSVFDRERVMAYVLWD